MGARSGNETGLDLALADALADAMSAVRRAVRRQTGSADGVAALTGAQLQLVRVLRRQPGISVAQAAAELGVAANTVSTLVSQLSDAHVLERLVSPGDRRVAHLYLAPAVADELAEWVERRSGVIASAYATLSEEDHRAVEQAIGPLDRLAAAIRGTRASE